MSDLPIRLQEAERRRLQQSAVSSIAVGGGSQGVSDGAFEVEVDDVTRLRIGVLEDGSVGIRFYDEAGNPAKTITEGSG